MRYFRLAEHATSVRTEVVAGVTTFLTMAYIIFVQPAVLSGAMLGAPTGMDFGAVTTATCLAAAFATTVMALVARYPIALAPGMGQNFFFVITAVPVAAAAGAAEPWRTALGAVFLAGVIFLALSLVGVRERLLAIVSADLKYGIAVGIGLFIAFIGLRNGQIIVTDPGTAVRLNPRLVSPDVVVFGVGFLAAAGLHARGGRGSLLWGMAAALGTALVLRAAVPTATWPEALLVTSFEPATAVVAAPPSLTPTLFAMDLGGALAGTMIPIVVVFLFMDVFDTMGTLIGVGEQAGLMRDGSLPRVERAMLADATGTVVGAALGTSTVTSYIESAAGAEQGGRTGLTALVVAAGFIVALFFYPLVAMVGSYPPITAPVLVLVGAMMTRNVTRITWSDYAVAIPAFVTMIGIPLTYSIADGITLGLVSGPLVMTLAGRAREISRGTWVLTGLVVAYLVFVRSSI